MTHEVDRWDAEEWLQQNKDIWNHPIVTDRTESNAYEVADLMADFANYILSKQEQKPKDMTQSAVEWLEIELKKKGFDFPYVTLKIKQAKEIEKQQIIDAIIISEKEHIIQGNVYPPQFVVDKAEQYYNETYGGNK